MSQPDNLFNEFVSTDMVSDRAFSDDMKSMHTAVQALIAYGKEKHGMEPPSPRTDLEHYQLESSVYEDQDQMATREAISCRLRTAEGGSDLEKNEEACNFFTEYACSTKFGGNDFDRQILSAMMAEERPLVHQLANFLLDDQHQSEEKSSEALLNDLPHSHSAKKMIIDSDDDDDEVVDSNPVSVKAKRLVFSSDEDEPVQEEEEEVEVVVVVDTDVEGESLGEDDDDDDDDEEEEEEDDELSENDSLNDFLAASGDEESDASYNEEEEKEEVEDEDEDDGRLKRKSEEQIVRLDEQQEEDEDEDEGAVSKSNIVNCKRRRTSVIHSKDRLRVQIDTVLAECGMNLNSFVRRRNQKRPSSASKVWLWRLSESLVRLDGICDGSLAVDRDQLSAASGLRSRARKWISSQYRKEEAASAYNECYSDMAKLQQEFQQDTAEIDVHADSGETVRVEQFLKQLLRDETLKQDGEAVADRVRPGGLLHQAWWAPVQQAASQYFGQSYVAERHAALEKQFCLLGTGVLCNIARALLDTAAFEDSTLNRIWEAAMLEVSSKSMLRIDGRFFEGNVRVSRQETPPHPTVVLRNGSEQMSIRVRSVEALKKVGGFLDTIMLPAAVFNTERIVNEYNPAMMNRLIANSKVVKHADADTFQRILSIAPIRMTIFRWLLAVYCGERIESVWNKLVATAV